VALETEANRSVDVLAVDAGPGICQAAENFGPRQAEARRRTDHAAETAHALWLPPG
jgi:hypothetical protein